MKTTKIDPTSIANRTQRVADLLADIAAHSQATGRVICGGGSLDLSDAIRGEALERRMLDLLSGQEILAIQHPAGGPMYDAADLAELRRQRATGEGVRA